MVSKSSPISIYALGGLGEVGKNTYCFESDRSLIMVDAGVRFPEPNLPGVDLDFDCDRYDNEESLESIDEF